MAIQSLSRDELLRILGMASARRERDRLMIALTFNHGLRASEVIELRRDNFDGTHLTVRRLKGSLKTTQELIAHSETLLDERKSLFDFLATIKGNERLFPITRQRFWQLIQEYGAAAGIPKHKRHPHVLKHSVAMQSVSCGVQNVKQWLGHRSLSSTGEYLKVNDEEAGRAVQMALNSLI